MVKKSTDTAAAATAVAAESTSSGGGVDTSSAKYKGVRKRKWGKWVSEIRLPNSRERIWLGSYDSPIKAARAFDAAQFCLRGRSANFNFPDNPPEIPASGDRPMTPAEIQAAAARFANTETDLLHHHRAAETATTTTTTTTTTAEEEVDSVSDGATTAAAQMESEVGGVEMSFYEQLKLSTNSLGSGNYGSDFGLYSRFDEFSNGIFYSQPLDNFGSDYGAPNNGGDGSFYSPPPDNLGSDYGVPNNEDGGGLGEDTYDASLYQDSFLWNF